MSKAKRQKRGFWVFYCLFVIFLCAFCIVGLSLVTEVLEDYESAQPYKTVERYLEKLREGDYGYVLGLSGFTWTDFADDTDGCGVLRERYEGKDLYYLESSTRLGSGRIRYNVYAGGERLGYVTLSQSEAKTKFGFSTWRLESCEPIEALEPYRITVPVGYTLYANGEPVGSKFIAETTVKEEYPLINGIPQPTHVIYALEGFVAEPTFTVSSLYNERYTEAVSEDGHILTYEREPVCYHEIYGFIRAAMEEYVNAISLRGEMENYLQCVLEGSEYAEVVKDFNSAWIMYQPEVLGTEVENFEISAYEEFTATQVIAEISFDYTVKLRYSTEVYPSKYRVICLLTEDGWKIASMENL